MRAVLYDTGRSECVTAAVMYVVVTLTHCEGFLYGLGMVMFVSFCWLRMIFLRYALISVVSYSPFTATAQAVRERLENGH